MKTARKSKLDFLPVWIGITLVSFAASSCGVRADVRISEEYYQEQVSSSHEAERIPVVINKNSNIYHLSDDCVHALQMSEENKLTIHVVSDSYLREHGYVPCKSCSQTKPPT